MRVRYPLVLIINYLLAKLAQCFSITGVPDVVVQHEIVSLTWSWALTDPTSIMIAVTRSDAAVAGIITERTLFGTGQTQGTLSFAFADARTWSIVGYDLATIAYDDMVMTKSPRPKPFFEDPHQITVVGPTSLPTSSVSILSLGGSSQGQAHTVPDSQHTSTTPTATSTPSLTVSNTSTSSQSRDTGHQQSLSQTINSPQQPTIDTDSTPDTARMKPGLIVGVTLGAIALPLLAGLGWYFWKRKGKGKATPSNELYPSPFPLPDTLEVGEAPPHFRTKNDPTAQATHPNDIQEPEQKECMDTQEDEIVSTPPAAADDSRTVEEQPRLEVPRVGIFHHTDSGWRLAFERHSQPSESGRGSLLEMPPSYSEAG
ncbi:hypothetical protein PQX77_012223 [Marasmius sp. AFHP31]|nr:hypothetical protein PQX77_012223 [Marasmius sp. AFHP31]